MKPFQAASATTGTSSLVWFLGGGWAYMNKFLSKRSTFVILVLLSTVLFGIYVQTRPQLLPGQEPLTDIKHIETVRTQFNKDVGKVRLILLAAPT